MSSLMLLEMGINAASAYANWQTQKAQFKIQQIQDKYQKTMTALSAARAHNQVTRNKVAMEEQMQIAEGVDQVAQMQDEEAARVAAATAGVEGNSVNTTLGDYARGAAQRRLARTREARYASNALNDQRREIEIAKVTSTPINILSKPSSASALLGLGTSLLDTYKAHMPATD